MKTSDGSNLPQGKRGGVTRITGKNGTFDVDKKEQQYKPEEHLHGPLATVGISLSMGQSTDYGREKYELTAWCSLPVPADEESIKDGYEVAYAFCMNELKARENDVQERFFPHLVKS